MKKRKVKRKKKMNLKVKMKIISKNLRKLYLRVSSLKEITGLVMLKKRMTNMIKKMKMKMVYQYQKSLTMEMKT